MRITNKDIQALEKLVLDKYGYQKYKAQARYNYIGIDEFTPEGGCVRTYRSGLTKKEAYYCLYDILEG